MAAASTRDLVVRIVGDAKGMTKATKEAETGLKGFEKGLGSVQKALAGAFAGGAILAFAKVSIQAALEDTRAQERLAKTLKNVVGANDEGVAAVERSIATMEKQFAVADDQLRPAFETLVRATKDVGQAQSLMQLALDVSAGSGKGLQEVTVALVKAMGGQMRGLKDLGINVKTAAGDTASFVDVQAQLVALFGGQAAAAADSQTGKLKALGIQYENLKESVGTALLPVLMQLADIANSLFGWFNGLSEGTQHLIAQVVVFGTVAIGAVKAFTAIKAAVIGMNIAMAASPIGLVAAGIAALAGAFLLTRDKGDDAAKATENYAKAVKQLGLNSESTTELLNAFAQINSSDMGPDAKSIDVFSNALKVLGLNASDSALLLQWFSTPGMKMPDIFDKLSTKGQDAARALYDFNVQAQGLPPVVEFGTKSLEKQTDAVKQAGVPTEEQTRKLAEMGRVQKQAGIEAERMATRITEAATKVRQSFNNTHNLTQATEDYKEALKNLRPSLKDAKDDALEQTLIYQDLVEKGLSQAEQAVAKFGGVLDEAGKQDMLIQLLSGIAAQVKDPTVQAMLAAYIKQLQILSGLTFNSSFNPDLMQVPVDRRKPKPKKKRAAGGPVLAGEMYLVGERGPETLVMGGQSGLVIPNGGSNGGNTYVVNVAAPDGKDPYAFGQAIVSALKTYVRTNGKISGVAA